MRSLSFLLICFWVFVFLFFKESNAADDQPQDDGVYIVYMGAAQHSPNGSPTNFHSQLLTSLESRKKNAVLHNYNNGFSGFAARLSKNEAISIAQSPGVVSVFPDPVLKLHTTHSWDFLKHQTGAKIHSHPSSDSLNKKTKSSGSNSLSNGADTIIGFLDTGIWPESESFNDKDMGPIPSRWKGTCMKGSNFTTSNCNRKLIGARYYDEPGYPTEETSTPRDQDGHGTHVAAIAAGSPVKGASYYGLAKGTAKGGSPGSRIAVYKICTPNGCIGSAILKAFDDAIGDGVDVISLSIGSPAKAEVAFYNDPIAIGAFHAVEKGILVVSSAGNDGPGFKSVVNVAPWILTVAATTIDRDFQVKVKLGRNKIIKGGGINFGNIKRSPVYPLIYGGSATNTTEGEASNCFPGSLDGTKVKGKIIVCDHVIDYYSAEEKKEAVMDLGGIGLILIGDRERFVVPNYGSFPMAMVTATDGEEIIAYINSTSNPLATISPTKLVKKYTPSPAVAYFSSRGPAYNTKHILKPDVAAPGVGILAAWRGNDKNIALSDKEPPRFNINSGTSISCPHVSGIAATVKSRNPSWSPSAIKSAIMTTAIQTNNLKAPITMDYGPVATPYDVGSGEVTILEPLNPGLVYETEVIDYLEFLCNSGYDISKIKLISTAVPDRFSCPQNSSSDSIPNMNYPSIAVTDFLQKKIRKVKRTVTNVGEDETTYTVMVDAPKGLQVEVKPNKLQFTKKDKKRSYEVTLTLNTSLCGTGEDIFGSITWTNSKYKVRSPVVVSCW